MSLLKKLNIDMSSVAPLNVNHLRQIQDKLKAGLLPAPTQLKPLPRNVIILGNRGNKISLNKSPVVAAEPVVIKEENTVQEESKDAEFCDPQLDDAGAQETEEDTQPEGEEEQLEELGQDITLQNITEGEICVPGSNERFVISSLEILEEGQQGGEDMGDMEEMEEGTILLEQAEDGSIIRVLTRPSDIIYNTSGEMDEGIDNEEEYEEFQDADGNSFIRLDASSLLSKGLSFSSAGTNIKLHDSPDKGIIVLDKEKDTPLVQLLSLDVFECLVCAELVSSKAMEEAGTTITAKVTGSSKFMTVHMRSEHDTRIYICDICFQVFRRKSLMTDHYDEHLVNDHGDFKCEVCSMEFGNLRLLRAHRRINHTIHKQHHCSICNKKFGSRNLLEEHNNTHNGVRPYSCELCSKTFASKYTYQSHLKTHMYRPRPFKCNQCGKAFFTLQNLSQHEKTHLGIKDFICLKCGKAFGTQHNLEVHGVVHTGFKPYNCSICGKSFARRGEIRDHERTHTGERPYVCELCGATFSQRSNLQSHKRATHFDDKRYKCHSCDKSFKRRRLLEYHTKASHTGERPYRCEVCDATFVYPEHFKKHQRIHSGEKPYKCEVCGKAFNSRDNRNAHRFIHSDKKPYECLDCGAGFMRKPLLYAHMHSLGHLSDTIVVNQPRISGDMDTVKNKYDAGNTFILDDGQEVIINNINTIKQEIPANNKLVKKRVITINKAPQTSQQIMETDDMFELETVQEEEEEQQEVTDINISSQGHILLQTGNVLKTEIEEDALTDEQFLEGAEDAIIATDEELHHQIIQSEDGTLIRLVEIKLADGESRWVALDT